ncbi:hypothetical protein [Actinomadura alba]|uniref:Holin n=1 Tax=Actinomadura alba TaxID=406431 RepID=A0ABR7LIC4_9ACTN|nr:hypothetical protein [Actinomadura alba]MBC6464245.1 hypothetical protein [Actinomadura alba]
MLKAFPHYWKTAVAALAPLYLLIQSAVSDDQVTTDEWAKIGGAVLGVILVWAVPNAPKPPVHEPATDRTPHM